MMGAYTYVLRGGVFCNAQTANIVVMSIAIGQGDWGKGLYYLIPISAYLLGAFVSEALPSPVKRLGLLRWDTCLVLLEFVVLFAVGWVPLSLPHQIVQVTINFIASMQYNTFRQAEGVPMATTFATNHIRQIGIGLAKEVRHFGTGKKEHRKKLDRHFKMLLFFVAGAVAGTVFCNFLLGRAIWITLIPFGAVLAALFGNNMKDGSIGKISENRFARADLEHILLCVDDDMRMEALRQTNYVKSIVTAQGKMDLERKGKQSYQGWMCARLLAFSNGDLQALFDRSDGFYRRQLVLTTKEKPAGRVDDPDLAEKMKAEVEGILLWAFEGLQRLAANNFKFTESDRTRENREAVKRDNNNVYDFLDSDGYVRLKADLSASSKELYEAYQIYCTENNLPALKPRSFSEALIACQSRYNLEYCNNVTNAAGRRVRGFLGIEVLVRNHISVFSGDSMRTYVPEDVPEEWRR